MTNQTIIIVSLKLFFGFLLAFLAILSWAKTREASWIFIIAGTLARYVELVYSLLAELEIYTLPDSLTGYLIESGLTLLPLIFLSLGFLLFLIKKRRF